MATSRPAIGNTLSSSVSDDVTNAHRQSNKNGSGGNKSPTENTISALNAAEAATIVACLAKKMIKNLINQLSPVSEIKNLGGEKSVAGS